MKYLSVLFLLFAMQPLAANRPHIRHVVVDSFALLHPTDSGHVYMTPFFTDTLQNDSFFKRTFSNYLLSKPQLKCERDDSQVYIGLKPAYRRDWVFYYVIFLLFWLLFIKYNFSKLFRNALNSFFSRAATSEIINDKYSPRWLFVFFSNLFFVMVISLWVYRVFITLDPPEFHEKPDVFLALIFAFSLVYIIKIIIHLVFGALFKASEAISIYILNFSIVNLVCGIAMLLTTLFLLYSPWHGQRIIVNLSFGIIFGFIVLRYFRGLSQTAQYFKYNYLYLILYLCSLEIAPWFLLIKYFNKIL